MLAAVCHDLGKPATTVEVEGRVRSPSHDAQGVAATRSPDWLRYLLQAFNYAVFMALVWYFATRPAITLIDDDEAVITIAGHDHGGLVELHQGTINQIPVDDDRVDIVFSRDMLTHVEDLDGALSECRRVLTPGGSMLIHQVFGTPLLEPLERARLCADLATVPDRLSIELFEDSVRRAGFAIRAIDRIGSEWLESLLEREDGEKRLLRAAHLWRAEHEMIAELGVIPFRVIQANNLWTIYRMIGKLEERVYSLTLAGT